MPIDLNQRLTEEQQKVRDTFLQETASYPALQDRIFQHFLITLHSRGILSIDEIYQRIAEGAHERFKDIDLDKTSENILTPSRWSEPERKEIYDIVLKAVALNFQVDEIADNVSMVVRREEVKNLEDIARQPNVSFDLLARKVREFCDLPKTSIKLPISDIMATRVCLQHHFISDQLDFIGIAKRYIRITDLNGIAENTSGPNTGMGRIGGKAAGMILANRIIDTHKEEFGREFDFPFQFPESHYLRADLYYDFVHSNGLAHYYDQKYKNDALIEKEFPVIREVFKNGRFPNHIMESLTEVLRKFGKTPLIVRSSSLLEDNFGAAFCGKYRSIYLPNQGSERERLSELVSAITEVYSGILHPNPISYRRKRNLLDYDEMMGILIQRVVGRSYGDYYFPLFSGVAYSLNEYRWSPRIRKEDGMLRMVMGLGTRAVDRVSSDYPRIVALTEPSLRSQGSVADILKYSQRKLDVINLKKNAFETIHINDLPNVAMPGIHRIISKHEEGMLKPVIGRNIDPSQPGLCITFDSLIQNTSFIKQMRWTLDVLQNTYGCPVDIEFSCDGKVFYLLQCRPLSKQIEWDRVHIPEDIEEQDKVFSAKRDIQNGILEDIEYIVYVPAEQYDAIKTPTEKMQVGRAIGALNSKLEDHNFILMGPGRWGSNDINLGVRVYYADISNTRALIEIGRSKNGYVPELSFGTHFYQDLVESQIFYLPLYPDDAEVIFNEDFFEKTRNDLSKFVPDFKALSKVIRVIDVKKASKGKVLNLYMDGETMRALAWLGKPRHQATIKVPGQYREMVEEE